MARKASMQFITMATERVSALLSRDWRRGAEAALRITIMTLITGDWQTQVLWDEERGGRGFT